MFSNEFTVYVWMQVVMLVTIFNQSLSLIIPVCVLMCVVRWSERLNSRRHIRHWKGFWPGNTLTCLFIFSCNFYWIVAKKNSNKYSYPGIFLITCVYPDVSRQFVTSWESSVALIDWTSVRSLVYLGDISQILLVFGLLVVCYRTRSLVHLGHSFYCGLFNDGLLIAFDIF